MTQLTEHACHHLLPSLNASPNPIIAQRRFMYASSMGIAHQRYLWARYAKIHEQSPCCALERLHVTDRTSEVWRDGEHARTALDAAIRMALRVSGDERALPVLLHAVTGGRHLRGLLSLATCEAAGVDPLRALPAAIAVELVHGASLVVDDLPTLDDARQRRGGEATHARFGTAAAVLAAHALVAAAVEVLADASADERWRLPALALLARTIGARGMVLGQLVERSDGPSLTIRGLKTAGLFSAAATMGGLAASCSGTNLEALAVAGRHWGMAYQLRDDLDDDDANDLGRDEMRRRIADELEFADVAIAQRIGIDAAVIRRSWSMAFSAGLAGPGSGDACAN